MATFDGLAAIATDKGFLLRVEYACYVAAQNIYSEVPTTQGHAARVVLAKQVFTGSFPLSSFAWSVLTNATISAEANPATTPDFAIPDGDIQFAVNSVWNAIAGA